MRLQLEFLAQKSDEHLEAVRSRQHEDGALREGSRAGYGLHVDADWRGLVTVGGRKGSGISVGHGRYLYSVRIWFIWGRCAVVLEAVVRQGGEHFPLSIPSFPAVANACFVFMGRVVNMVEASIVSGASGWTSSDSAGEFGPGDDGGWAILIEPCTKAEIDSPYAI